jgi:hypothetical protein
MSAWADEAVVAYDQRMGTRTAKNGVLHDDALSPDGNGSTLRDDLGAKHDSATRTNRNVSAYDRIRRDPGRRINIWQDTVVFDEQLVLLGGLSKAPNVEAERRPLGRPLE